MNQKSAAAGAPAQHDGRATILIVEDSPTQAELLRRALESARYEVIVASDGAEGLALAKAKRPDAVISDITMPIMDGYAMCQAIRREESLKTTPVMLLTMLSDPEDVLRGLNAGADAYLTKPYNVPSLLARIATLLANPPAPPPERERRILKVLLAGEAHSVEAHGPRMLNLLISTYENAVLQNRELTATQQALEDLNLHLEQRVLEQTAVLQARERRFRSLIENASDLVTVIDDAGTIMYVSPSVKRLVGYEAEEIRGTHFLDYVASKDRSGASTALSEILCDPGKLQVSEYRFRHKDGTWVTLDSIARNALDDPSINGIVINSRDITERNRAAAQLIRLNWALRALGQSNSALVHADNEKELFQSCCDAIAGAGGYPLAWIGLAQHDAARSVLIGAAAGEAIGFLEGFTVSWADELWGQGPTGTAIRTGTTQVIDDLSKSAAYRPWIERALAHGLASSISLPILGNGVSLGTLVVCSREPDAFGQPEVSLFEELAADIGYGIVSRRTRTERDQLQQEQVLGVQRLKSALIRTIGAVALTVEKRDPYTAGHQRRVAELSVAIGRELKLSEDRLEGLRLGATIHDIGKISVPAEILNRPGKLMPLEFEFIKSHPQVGYEIIKDVTFPWPVTDMVLQHHERLDGSGYPRGLKTEQIILEARIIAVADVFEAMASHRPYRPALEMDKALAEIDNGRETLFDVAVADACLKLFRESGYTIPA